MMPHSTIRTHRNLDRDRLPKSHQGHRGNSSGTMGCPVLLLTEDRLGDVEYCLGSHMEIEFDILHHKGRVCSSSNQLQRLRRRLKDRNKKSKGTSIVSK